jgi:hypothetical protein
VPALNDSEIGFYYIKYNSRLPYISGIVNQGANTGTTPSVYVEYPENIDLFGISINTMIPGGWSLGAEYSFRHDTPIQWNAFELITGGLQQSPRSAVAASSDPATAASAPAFPDDPISLLAKKRLEEAGLSNIASLSGQDVDGYDRYDVSQAQFTLIKFFDQVMGASRLSLINEVGATYVHSLPGTDEARYGRSGTYGLGPVPLIPSVGPISDFCTRANLNTAYCENEGFTTDFSWGYRTRLVWDYLNAFSGVNLYPRLAWSHDVKGYAPQPGGAFNEGKKSIGLGLEAVYQNKLSADVSYTNYFGGKPYNDFRDRDFISASVSYSF